MNAPLNQSPHTFHIPVMGIGFTIDTPIRLAPLGVDSSISLVNDDVIEAARAYHSKQRLLPYAPIEKGAPNSRSERITSYLNLVAELVKKDTEKLRSSSFHDGPGISRYFQLLPTQHPLRLRYLQWSRLPSGAEKDELERSLRSALTPGTIGVNIMTKLDGDKDAKGQPRGAGNSDALAALRGFAQSSVEGPLILSAGANPSLFAYLGEFPDFFPDSRGEVKKQIILKVSDFRSAHVQGRMLARRGIWVSEYRIESGLNCGGHAFPTEGLLLGPILKEFQSRRDELGEGLFKSYQKGLRARGIETPAEPPQVLITAQGGVGTAQEAEFLRSEFGVDRTGWGSPFLMVPEAVIMDSQTMNQLEAATEKDVSLSWSSPLGVRFWWLKTCESETKRLERIASGHSGSVCTARHVALNSDYGSVPLCLGSRAYQRKKKAELDPAHPDYEKLVERIEAPACICVDLCGSFLQETESKKPPPAAICPGPNIVNFTKKRTLEQMVDHIYGRTDVLTRPNRPHVFVREVELYLQVFHEDLQSMGTSLERRSAKQLRQTLAELERGLEFYSSLTENLDPETRNHFVPALADLSQQLSVAGSRLETREESMVALEEPSLLVS